MTRNANGKLQLHLDAVSNKAEIADNDIKSCTGATLNEDGKLTRVNRAQADTAVDADQEKTLSSTVMAGANGPSAKNGRSVWESCGSLDSLVAAVSKLTLVDQLDVINRNSSVDKQLTLARLKCVNVLGDGNCLFRSLSVCLYNYKDRYSELRSQIVHHMSVNYSAIIPDFCNKSTDTDKNSIDQKTTAKADSEITYKWRIGWRGCY